MRRARCIDGLRQRRVKGATSAVSVTLLLLAAQLAATVLLGGCAATGVDAPAPESTGTTSTETTELPEGHPAMTSAPDEPVPTEGVAQPEPPVFTTPAEAVRSYLEWISYAYEIANSDAAAMTFSAYEEVRINSYVQLNKEKGQRLRQRLVTFEPGRASITPSAAVLPAFERWDYRYLDLTSAAAKSPTYTVSYEATYTLVPREGGGWIVDRLEVKALDKVK